MQDGSEYIKQQVSLLMMRLWVSTEQGEPEELGDYPDLEALVAMAGYAQAHAVGQPNAGRQ